MGNVRVKKNRLGAISREIGKVPTGAIGESSDKLVDLLSSGAKSVWGSSTIASTVKDRSNIPAHAAISIGLNKAKGFYSRFLEWGTKNHNARPMVTPRAESFRAEFANIAKSHIKKAVNAS